MSAVPVIAVLGAGAWGTAFALHLTRAQPDARIILWGRDAQQIERISATRSNNRYLPNVSLPAALELTADLAHALRDATLIIAASPVAALPELAQAAAPLCPQKTPPFFWLSKGFLFDGERIVLPHQVLCRMWLAPVGAISGPSFAQEVAAGLPTALVVAGTHAPTVENVAGLVRSATLRTYPNPDIVGVETGGATKNVLAIATGISDGLHLGLNARATLITRGLVEMNRLAEMLGDCSSGALMGLAGIGDLILTCTGDLSRNRRVGLMLAEGLTLPDILARLGHVAEGVTAARAAARLAEQHKIDLPIATGVAQILDGKISPRAAAELLLSRRPKSEDR